MRLHLLNRSSVDNTSVKVSQHIYKNFLKVWHFHEELELVYIIESTGTRFVGDHIEKFQAGEIVLIGKNVPHMWLNDDAYFEKGSNQGGDNSQKCIYTMTDEHSRLLSRSSISNRVGS